MKGNSKAVDTAARFLRKEVTSNNLKPGDHIAESAIARTLNLSRVPVREAFRLLQSEGYLILIPNKGCFVKKISKQYVYETTIVYKLLAPVVLENAIPNYTASTYKKADKILSKIEKCKDFTAIGYYLWDFAKLIYKPSKMDYMLNIFDELYKNSIRTINELFLDKDTATFKVTSHRDFIELCRQNKKDEAIKLWSEFIDVLTDMLFKK